jgi:1-deoxy-D-xylulose-5-phosphate synthase
MNEHGYKNDVRILGIPDHIVEHGTLKELHKECGYDAAAIAKAVREMLLCASISSRSSPIIEQQNKQ